MEILRDIISNHTLIVPIIAWALSQVFKTFTYLIIEKKLDMKRIISDGGMPSAHSATVISLMVMCGWSQGFGSALFAVSMIFAIVVMRDAVGVRREAGKQAASIKELASTINKAFLDKNAEIRTENLKVLVGHTPLQVISGAFLGFIISISYILIFLVK